MRTPRTHCHWTADPLPRTDTEARRNSTEPLPRSAPAVASSQQTGELGDHLAVEQGQRPPSLLVTAGQRNDSPQFQPVLEGIRVPRTGPGRPRIKPGRVRADRAYGSRASRAYLRQTWDWLHHPGEGQPGPQLQKTRLPRRPPAQVRQGRLKGAPRGGVWNQQAQAPPGRGHDIRETRCPP
ncbi:transposase [Streptomyces sp. NPDC055721]|uniref:transposase n=1 Tax=Streptomyces sp. NPDC127132 TaxID=3345374 RepID=UPI0036333514